MFLNVANQPKRDWMKSCEFILARSPNDLFDFAAKATTQFGHDLETTSLHLEKTKIVGYSCAYDETHALYYPVAHQVGSELNLPSGPILEVLRRLDVHPKPFSNVWYNYTGFDGEILLHNFGWDMTNWDCAQIAIFLTNSNSNEYGLKDVAARELGIEMITFDEVSKGMSFDLTHPEDSYLYAASDACVNLRVWNLPKVQQTIGPSNVHEMGQQFIYNLEKQVGIALRTGCLNKVWLSQTVLDALKKDVNARIKVLESAIYEAAGATFRIGSAVDLGNKLVKLGVNITDTTGKSGQVKTRKDTLERHRRDHPIVPMVIQYKELATQERNYIDKLQAAINHFGPAVRFHFRHIGVPTGRMKSGGSGRGVSAYDKGVVDLNIQSIPDSNRKPYLPNIRSAIVANDPTQMSKDWAIVSIDYSQVELRVAGNMSKEKAWIDEFSKPNSDIHNKNAELAYKRKINPKASKEEKALRDRGKTISFAILYGGSKYTVADHAGISLEQGDILVKNFFAGAPDLAKWISGWSATARNRKYVKTYFGRIRHLNEYYAEGLPRSVWFKGDREAINSPIQGGAADIFKIASVKVQNMLVQKGWQNDCKVILWMHDEILFRCRVSMLETIIPEIRKTMEFEVKYWPIKLATDAEAGWDWGHLKPYDDFLRMVKDPSLDGEKSAEEREFDEDMLELRGVHGSDY